MLQQLLTDSASSLARVALGSLAGVLFGILLGSLRYSLLPKRGEPVLVSFLFEFMRFPPPIAWLPFVILWAGIGGLSSVIVVFLAVFPAVATNTFEGLRQIPPGIRRLAQSLEIPSWPRIRKIYLPMMAPQLFTGFRLGLGMGWMSIIAAEMVGGQEGLGYSIQLNRTYSQYSVMVLDIAAIALVGYLLQAVLNRLESWLAPWSVSGGARG